jgi:PAS domain S-box-containing protein
VTAQLHATLLLVGFCACLFLWALLYAHDWRAAANRALRFLLLDGALWSLLDLSLYLPISEGFETTILRATGPLLTLSPALWLEFACAFGRRRRGWLWKAVVAVAAITGAVYACTDLCVVSAARAPDGALVVEEGGSLAWIKALAGVNAIAALWSFGRGYLAIREPAQRRALGAIALGVLLAAVATGGAEIALQLADRRLSCISSFFLVLVPFICFAIFRHGFLSVDLSVVATRLLSNARDGIIVIDRWDRIRQMNPAAIALIGLKDAEVSGAKAEAIIPGWPELAARGRAEAGVAGPDGVARSLALSVSSPTRGGERFGRIVLLRDATDRVRAKEALARSHADLEAEVEHRTAELRRVQRMEAMGALTGSIAHDFNNILAAIIGFATAARDDLPERHAIRRDLDEVLAAARRARDTVSQLLAFGRQGGDERREPLEIGEFVESTLSFLESSLPAAISLRRELFAEKRYVMGHATQLHQVIVNLTTNAVQRIGRRKGAITVTTAPIHFGSNAGSARRTIEPGESIVIAVADDGPGIPRDRLDRVFDPFSEAAGGGEAPGLGLPTALRIVQDHGGTIAADSHGGAGATFTVFLPLIEPPRRRDALELVDLTGGEHVLLVEAVPPARRNKRRLLVSLGYRVTAHAGAEAALADYRKSPGAFDAIIVAAEIDGRGGLDLAAQLLEERATARIIVTCPKPDLALAEAARGMGVVVVVEREAAPDELASALHRFIETTRDGISQPLR